MPWGLNANSFSSSNLHGLNLNHHSSSSSTNNGSAPPSRPSSPGPHSSNSHSHTSSPHHSLPPSRQGSIALPRPTPSNLHGSISGAGGGGDPFPDYYSNTPGSTPITSGFPSDLQHDTSNPSTPSIASSYSNNNSYFANQTLLSSSSSNSSSMANLTSARPHTSHSHMEINLEQDQFIMRGVGADTNPCLLSGEVVLFLSESTNIKEVDLKLEGKGKVVFTDGTSSTSGSKNHHYTHSFLNHDWSLLQGAKNHYHTLKAGRHAFPFTYTFEGSIPSSIHTYANDAAITYKLKATAVRSTFQTNFHATKNLDVVRGFTNEALEYNQTLEIENTWPGKVMYCLTLPHKAYAAGDEIPVNIKFMPLAKQTRVLHISSIVKEYSTVHTRHSSHSESRIAASSKHIITDGKAYRVNERGMESGAPPHHYHGEGSGEGISGLTSAPPSAPPSPTHRAQRDLGLGHVTPMSDGSMSRVTSSANLVNNNNNHNISPGNMMTPQPTSRGDHGGGYFASPANGSGVAGPSTGGPGNGTVADIPDDLRERELNIGDEEVDTMITIPIPSWTTPSHSIYPVFVTHKIKWSCAISNPDGHISELRCALPIVILPHSLLTESQAATSATRNLLFGGGDTEVQVVDLPSYNDHVYDRVAGMAPGPLASTTYVSSGHRTPGITPPHSRGPSRPASPTRGMSSNNNNRGHHTPEHTDADGDDDIPVRPELSNWADSELLLSLGALANANNSPRGADHERSPHDSPADSRTPSRPGSRLGFTRTGRTSQPGSRSGSRANSPERPPSIMTIGPGNAVPPPPMDRRSSHGIPNLFHLPHALKPLSSVRQSNSRNTSSTNLAGMNHEATSPIGSPRLTAHQQSSAGGLPRATFSLGSHSAFTQLAQNSQQVHPGGSMTPPNERMVDPLSQVPSYAIASRGFLGGGVVPLSTGPPLYIDSENLERTKSETALDQMGRGESGDAVDPTSLAAAMERLTAASARRDDVVDLDT